MAEHIRYMVETIAHHQVDMIQRYKTDEYSTRNAGWEAGERVGMDSVDPQELITTLRQTHLKVMPAMRSSSHC